MPTHNKIKCSLYVAGEIAKEYSVSANGEDQQENGATCYVEAKNHARFYLDVDISEFVKSRTSPEGYFVKLYADDVEQNRVSLYTKFAHRHHWKIKIKDSIRFLSESQYQYGDLKFGPVNFCDEDSAQENTVSDFNKLSKMGTLRISVHTALPAEPLTKKGIESKTYTDYEKSAVASVLETKAKGFAVSHRVYHDNLETKTYKITHLRKTGPIITSFTFKYLSMRSLKVQGIVPTTPEPDSLLEVQGPPAEEDDIDGDVDKMSNEELRRYVKNMKRSNAAVKREADFLPGGSGSKRMKTETIDLTED